MTSTHVKVNRVLSVPPVAFDLPLTGHQRGCVTIAPPSAHIGSAPVLMRLISYELREGQVPTMTAAPPACLSWSHSACASVPPGQRDSAVPLPCRGGGHLLVPRAQDQAAPVVPLPSHPLPRRRLCGPNLPLPRGEETHRDVACTPLRPVPWRPTLMLLLSRRVHV